MALKNPISGGTWNTISLAAQYAATGSGYLVPAYRKDAFGIVHLRGTASYISGTVTNIFTLPAGFRPTGTARFIVFSVDTSNGVAVGWLDMRSDGTLAYLGGSAYVLSFDQISFATY